MKNWYYSLKKSIRFLLHITSVVIVLLCFIILYTVNVTEVLTILLALLSVISAIFEVVFINWELKSLKLKFNSSSNKEQPNETKVIKKSDINEEKNALEFEYEKLNNQEQYFDIDEIKKFDVNNPLSKVRIIDIDGSIMYVPCYHKITDNRFCLISEGGRTFHTHCNCYHKWKPEYKNNFNGWKIISVEEAQRNGLKKCAFCQFEDMSVEEKLTEMTKGREYYIFELGGYANEEVQNNIECAIPFDSVDIEFDFDNNKYFVMDSGELIGNIKSKDIVNIQKLTGDIETAEAYVYETYINDDLKEKIKILIIADR